jgi:hypothetical protein
MSDTETSKRKVPSVKEVLAEQDRQADLLKATTVAPTTNLPVPAEDAFSRHVNELTAGTFVFPGTLFDMHGIDGTYNTVSGNTEIKIGGLYVPHFEETYWGYVHYGDENRGVRWKLACLAVKDDLPCRKDLDDQDKTKWLTGKFSPQPEDPWKEVYACPLEAKDAGGELYVFLARTPTTRAFMKSILLRYNRHPRTQRGFRPIIRLDVEHFFNSYNNKQPKPAWPFVDWIDANGVSFSAQQAHAEFKDSVPF